MEKEEGIELETQRDGANRGVKNGGRIIICMRVLPSIDHFITISCIKRHHLIIGFIDDETSFYTRGKYQHNVSSKFMLQNMLYRYTNVSWLIWHCEPNHGQATSLISLIKHLGFQVYICNPLFLCQLRCHGEDEKVKQEVLSLFFLILLQKRGGNLYRTSSVNIQKKLLASIWNLVSIITLIRICHEMKHKQNAMIF